MVTIKTYDFNVLKIGTVLHDRSQVDAGCYSNLVPIMVFSSGSNKGRMGAKSNFRR